MTGRIEGVVESVLVVIAWVAFVLGSSIAAMTLPVYTSATVQALGVPASAGLSASDTVRLSGMIRALVSDPDFEPIPATWRGRPAFDREAVSHLMDVRAVISGARVATAVAAALLAGWIGVGIARRRWDRLARGMRAGGIGVLVMVVVALVVATLDFSTFFAAFHGLFFKAGTWQFPYDSLLIRLFPERFWVTAGITWGVLSAALAAVLLVAAAHVSKASPPTPSRQARGSIV